MNSENTSFLLEVANQPHQRTYEDNMRLRSSLSLVAAKVIDVYPVMTTEGAPFDYLFTDHDDYPSTDLLERYYPNPPREGLVICSRLSIEEAMKEMNSLEH